jgi:hypothetical protein
MRYQAVLNYERGHLLGVSSVDSRAGVPLALGLPRVLGLPLIPGLPCPLLILELGVP